MCIKKNVVGQSMSLSRHEDVEEGEGNFLIAQLRAKKRADQSVPAINPKGKEKKLVKRRERRQMNPASKTPKKRKL